MRIAVDAMGGDNAPQVIVQGAVMAARESVDVQPVLVGPRAALLAELARHGTDGSRLPVVDAPDLIGMAESPAQAVRRKPQSSVVVATRLQREGKADALVSAGNTGAVVATSLLELGRLPGVLRPAIAVVMPNASGGCIILDVGATTDCKPVHLLQFAMMGEFYARILLGRERPRVGLLNVGEESSKGNEISQEAHRLLAESRLNFVGNVEGRGIFAGAADVIVCDGFVGNVILKFSESVVAFVSSLLREELRKSFRARVAVGFLRPALSRFRRRMDYAEYGGAPLLGVNGVCIIAHGSSSPRAIKNAIVVAARLARTGANQRFQEQLQTYENVEPGTSSER